jgi:uridylate kinase
MELKCEVIVKATKVDGVYDKDPLKYADAVKYKTISYADAISQRLGVMDTTAISLAMENNMPIIVCNMFNGDITRLVLGEEAGTVVQGE